MDCKYVVDWRIGSNHKVLGGYSKAPFRFHARRCSALEGIHMGARENAAAFALDCVRKACQIFHGMKLRLIRKHQRRSSVEIGNRRTRYLFDMDEADAMSRLQFALNDFFVIIGWCKKITIE